MKIIVLFSAITLTAVSWGFAQCSNISETKRLSSSDEVIAQSGAEKLSNDAAKVASCGKGCVKGTCTTSSSTSVTKQGDYIGTATTTCPCTATPRLSSVETISGETVLVESGLGLRSQKTILPVQLQDDQFKMNVWR